MARIFNFQSFLRGALVLIKRDPETKLILFIEKFEYQTFHIRPEFKLLLFSKPF